MSTSTRRVPVRYFRLLADLLKNSGIETTALLDSAGLDHANFLSRDGMLSSEEVDRFIATANRLSGRSDLGFELGRNIKLNSHDRLGYGLLSCADIDEFLGMASRHYHLMTETWVLNYRRWYSGGEAVYTPTAAMSPETLQFYLEVLVLAHQNQINQLLGSNAHGYDMYISMPAPKHLNRYLALSPVRFHFHEDAPLGIRVVMGADLLNFPLQLSNPSVVQQVDEECNALAKRPSRTDIGWTEYLIMLLRKTNGEQVTLEDLARQIKVSPRTIDRHLKKEGLGFRELSNKVRFERACDMLSNEGMTVAEVALKLGFSDTANFSRAFRREIGVSPSEHQRSAGTAQAKTTSPA